MARSKTYYTFQGKTLTQEEWAETIGITQAQLCKRVKKFGIATALSTPPNKSKRNKMGKTHNDGTGKDYPYPTICNKDEYCPAKNSPVIKLCRALRGAGV